jgi:copper(I)-binding protein
MRSVNVFSARTRRSLLAAAALLLLPAAPYTAAAGDALHIEGAWVRAMPPTQRMTAAYLVCSNHGDTPLTLEGARAPIAAEAGLHRSEEVEGRVRMRAVDRLTLQPGERLEFRPGGLHVMLMGMSRMPSAGETLELCLLSDRGSHCVQAEVRDGPAAQGGHAHDHHAAHSGSAS